jgi:hypothetical protein
LTCIQLIFIHGRQPHSLLKEFDNLHQVCLQTVLNLDISRFNSAIIRIKCCFSESNANIV